MIDTNGFLGWMVGSNVYHVYVREVTPAKGGGGGRWNCNGDERYKRICLAQYFSLFGAFSALFSSLLPPLSPITVHWVEGCRDSNQDSGIARINNQSC
jgi:hypothetical protein